MMPAQAAVAGTPQQAPVAVVPRGGTVGLAATPQMTQPNMGRAGGPPAAMHAQMGGMAHAPVSAMSRAAPAGGRGSQSGGGGHSGSDHRH
jgi:alpha-glucosidase